MEADHVHPISKDPFGRNDNTEDLELLCEECHMDKTVAQKDDRDFNPLLSYVNPTPGATSSCPSLFRINAVREDRECQNVDIIRCRRNMLCNSVYPWCVFSIWDDVTPRESCDLKDFNFVSKAAPRTASDMLKMAPHVGAA